MNRRTFLTGTPAAAAAATLTLRTPDGLEHACDLGVLRLQAGDRLVVTLEGRVDGDTVDRIRTVLKAAMPPGVQVLIVDDSVTFGIIRPEGGTV
jgi:hypothetical protein